MLILCYEHCKHFSYSKLLNIGLLHSFKSQFGYSLIVDFRLLPLLLLLLWTTKFPCACFLRYVWAVAKEWKRPNTLHLITVVASEKGERTWMDSPVGRGTFSSVQFSHSVVSDSLWPHGLQHARPPCPSPTPGLYSHSYPLSSWCHPTISSSVITFSSCLQSFPASGSFSMSQLFISGGQSIGVSASASVLPMNTQDWFPLGWTGYWLGLLAVLGTIKSLLQHHSSKASIL